MVYILKFQKKHLSVYSPQDIQQKLLNLGLRDAQENLYFTCNGRRIELKTLDGLEEHSTILCQLRLKGGKGGFGAKLKTEGGKKVRPNENMFSRDTSGRRIAYNMIEKEYTQFCKKKNAQDQKVKKERQQFNIMQSTLKEGHAFMKLDKQYNDQLSETERNVEDAFKFGLQMIRQKNSEEKKGNSPSHQSEDKKEYCESEQRPMKKQETSPNIYEIISEKRESKELLQPVEWSFQTRKRSSPVQREVMEKEKQDIINNGGEPIKMVKTENPMTGARAKLKSIFKK